MALLLLPRSDTYDAVPWIVTLVKLAHTRLNTGWVGTALATKQT